MKLWYELNMKTYMDNMIWSDFIVDIVSVWCVSVCVRLCMHACVRVCVCIHACIWVGIYVTMCSTCVWSVHFWYCVQKSFLAFNSYTHLAVSTGYINLKTLMPWLGCRWCSRPRLNERNQSHKECLFSFFHKPLYTLICPHFLSLVFCLFVCFSP